MLEIQLQGFFDAVADHAGIQHEMGNGPVAVSGGPLRQEDGGIDVDFTATIAAEHGQESVRALGQVLSLDHVRRGDSAGVHHGVERAVRPLVQNDGVEGIPGGFDAYFAEHVIPAMILQGQAINKRLRHGLDGEQSSMIAHVEDLPVRGHQRDGEPIGICLGKFRDVIGDPPLGEGLVLEVQISQDVSALETLPT